MEERRGGPGLTLALWILLVPVGVLSWIYTIRISSGMWRMPGAAGMGPAEFVGMWTVMMAAMMLPSVTPVAALYLRILGARTLGPVRIARSLALLGGYLSVWGALGLIAYAMALGISAAMASSPALLLWVTALVLVVSGLYQLSPVKDRCLEHCRAPLGFLLHVSSFTGRLRDFRAGVHHGAFCIGCCAGLMAVMVVVGVMNVFWMVLLAGAILVEKHWRHGRAFALVTGVGLVAIGIAIPLEPRIVDLLGIAAFSGPM